MQVSIDEKATQDAQAAPAGQNKKQEDNSVQQFKDLIEDIKFTKKVYTFVLPAFASQLIASFTTIMSAYVASQYFDFIYYTDTIKIQCIYQILSLAYQSGSQLVTLRQVRAHLLKGENEEAQFVTTTNILQQLVMAVICSIIGACLCGILKISSYRAFEYYVFAIGGPIFAVLNFSQDFRYYSENRRLVHFSRAIMTTLIQLALEYIFYISQTKVTSTWATAVAFLISQLASGVWLSYINFGYTIFGVQNRIIMKNDFKSTIKNPKFVKTFFSDIGGSITNMCNYLGLPVSVLLSQHLYQKFSSSVYLAQQEEAMFSFFILGAVYRSAPIAFGFVFLYEAFGNVDRGNLKQGLASIISYPISSIFVTAILFVLFAVINGMDFFFELGIQPMTSAQLYAAILAALQIFNELGIYLSLVFEQYLTVICIGILRVAVGIFSSLMLDKLNGDRADYLFVMLFEEGSGQLASLIICIIHWVRIKVISSKVAKDGQRSTKKGKINVQDIDAQLGI